MSANGAVWGRVRSRLRAFPEHLAACGAEVSSGLSPLAGGGENGGPVEAALPSGLPLGFGVRQVRAGLHRPRRPPEEGPVRARVRGPEELLRRRGRWARPVWLFLSVVWWVPPDNGDLDCRSLRSLF